MTQKSFPQSILWRWHFSCYYSYHGFYPDRIYQNSGLEITLIVVPVAVGAVTLGPAAVRSWAVCLALQVLSSALA